jgi:hypothetical protein
MKMYSWSCIFGGLEFRVVGTHTVFAGIQHRLVQPLASRHAWNARVVTGSFIWVHNNPDVLLIVACVRLSAGTVNPLPSVVWNL